MIIADTAFLTEFSSLPESQKQDYLFLENHPQIEHFWLVESFDPAYKKRLGDRLPRHRYLSPFAFDAFAEQAEAEGYSLVFLDDPKPIFQWIDSLSAVPCVEIQSNLPGTIRGLLPFQVQAFNFAKDLYAAILNLSTGTGKTTIACALTEYQFQTNLSDLALWVVKSHNKINTARMIERFTGHTPTVIDGDRASRQEQYSKFQNVESPILVVNYEAFRFDYDELEALLTDRRVFIVWDELPTKLRTRQTQLYRSVCRALYKSQAGGVYYPSNKQRPSELRQVMLSATPIEHDPEDWFNAVRLLDPSVYGSVRDFNNAYIAHRNLWGQPDRWRNLDLMGALASPLVYQVDKSEPHIAAQFPAVIEYETFIDLSISQRILYDQIMSGLVRPELIDPDEILSAIQILQWVCDMPMAVVDSARVWRDSNGQRGSAVAAKMVALIGEKPFATAGNAKMQALDDLWSNISSVINSHGTVSSHAKQQKAKMVIFAPHAHSVLPHISEYFAKVDHVTFHGGLSTKEKQAAQDRFTNDPNCRLFLSSDAGSDSINLECAQTVVHYSLPWSWATLTQRQNRIHRITSTHSHVLFNTLVTTNSVEERKLRILAVKADFHVQVLRGEIAHQSEFLRSQSDLLYILNG